MHLDLVRLTDFVNAFFIRHTCPVFCFRLPKFAVLFAVRLLDLLLPDKLSKLRALKKLQSSKDGAKHIAAQSH